MIGVGTVAERWLSSAAPDRPALREGDEHLTYAELRDRVGERGERLGLPNRSVVALTGDRSIEFVVTYLTLLDRGHVPLLVADHVGALVGRWPVAAAIRADRDGWTIEHTSNGPLDLHPDLALLLSTSGSTGNPKLVRLSQDNLRANAASIAAYLRLTKADRGITTLPLHYCYGLSVLHSHLSVGAGVTLIEASVVDPCFRDALVRDEVTNIAGVPYTFDLLERVGPERIRVPSLRLVTQAGGRLAPERVSEWLDRAESWGSEFVVMYGQTEATARMAYLPPDVARHRPETIGRPIPGGALSIRPSDDATELEEGVGELVYDGPNVMLGYATEVADLARGRELHTLRTGDLARYHADDDVFEIVGRRSRFVKPFGVRVDLDDIERYAADVAGLEHVAATGDDDRLVVAVPGADAAAVGRAIVERTGLPRQAVVVDADAELPFTAAGKIDYPAIARRAEAYPDDADPSSVASIFGGVLDRRGVRSDDTFVGLGGDSLSYVECSIRLERALGHLPDGWHLRPVAELDALASYADGRRWVTRIDSTVILRAIGICAIVATHMRFWRVPGGSNILLAVVGFNLARFLMPIERTGDILRAGLRTIGRVAVPTVAWVAGGLLFTNAAFGLGTLLLINNYAGPAGHQGDEWHFWFIEVFVHLVVIAMLLFAIPQVRRSDRRWPFAFPLAVLGMAVLLRSELLWADDWFNYRYRTHSIAWFFVLGWLIQRSNTVRQRLLVTGLFVALIPGTFDQPEREIFIALALVPLIWLREVPVPRAIVRPIATLASASMWILITHFTFWPPLTGALPLWSAYLITLAIGVAFWAAAEFALPVALRAVRKPLDTVRSRPPLAPPPPAMAT